MLTLVVLPTAKCRRWNEWTHVMLFCSLFSLGAANSDTLLFLSWSCSQCGSSDSLSLRGYCNFTGRTSLGFVVQHRSQKTNTGARRLEKQPLHTKGSDLRLFSIHLLDDKMSHATSFSVRCLAFVISFVGEDQIVESKALHTCL